MNTQNLEAQFTVYQVKASVTDAGVTNGMFLDMPDARGQLPVQSPVVSFLAVL